MRSSEFITEVKARYEMTDLDPWTFDQTPAGWRGLPSSARQADAIQQYIETYVKDGRFVGAPEGAKTLRPYILYWHLGQVLTQMGRNGMAVEVMRRALDDGEPGWNAYVMATISFLRKDRRDFDHWAPLARGNEETIQRLTAGWGLPYKQAYAGQSAVAEVSPERLQTYLSRAGQQVDRRQERMAQARERLNKSYEIYHADRPAGSSQIVDRFESDTPAQAQRYYEKFIQNYESDRDFDLRLRRSTGIVEDSFQGIDISMEKEDDEIMVRASADGKQLGSVLFVEFDGYLMPQDLEVDERFCGQGIAQAMYDYVKSKGYRIRRSGQQTDAGQGFWAKHRADSNVWEQNVEENFADGKVKGKSRPGRVKRAGASCNGSVTDLRRRAKNASGEKAKMYHWCANMKSGRKK